jgi:hypothetical protein
LSGGVSAITLYHPIAEPDDAVGIVGDIFLVGHKDNGIA